MWENLSNLTGSKKQMDMLGGSSLWICEKTHKVSNIDHMAALWSLWKLEMIYSLIKVGGVMICCKRIYNF
jgi:hypothetical protein